MTLHIGEPVLYRGERHIVKDVISPTWPVIEDEEGFAFAVRPEALIPVARVTYTPNRLCFVCGRREGDSTVVVDGNVEDICDTCWERVEDDRNRYRHEMEEGDDDA